MKEHQFRPYEPLGFKSSDMGKRAEDFLRLMLARRSLREFSRQPVPRRLIEIAIRTASTAPSGANRQPWCFVAISDPRVKQEIRRAAEAEEKKSYEERMPSEWLEVLEPLGTDWRKPFLEEAPWLVVVFAESYALAPGGAKAKNYYVQESVGIACGLFIAALHNMGLVTLTHTPSPMGFLSEILHRPKNERPFILFPVGYPGEDATVPVLTKKAIEEVSVWVEGS